MTWPTVKIGDICKVVSGATPKTGTPEYWNGDIWWAAPKDLSGHAEMYIHRTSQQITESGYKNCSTELLPVGSVLFSSRAPIGYVAINTVPLCTNQGFKSFVPDASRLHSEFLYFWLKANRRYLESLGNGATFKELSKATVERVEIPLPPLSEQRRIAAILDKADVLRQKRREALAHLDRLLQSVFVEMFGDPVTNPKGWQVATLNDVADSLRNGLSPASDGKFNGKVLTLSAITRGFFDPSAVKTAMFSGDLPEDKRVSTRDFLICCGNGNVSLVGSGKFPIHDMDSVLFPDTMIAATIRKEQIVPAYLEAIWSSRPVRRQIESVARTTNGTFKVNQETLGGIKFMIPPLDAQEAFARFAQQLTALQVRQQAAQVDSISLFASLQARAFAGEL